MAAQDVARNAASNVVRGQNKRLNEPCLPIRSGLRIFLFFLSCRHSKGCKDPCPGVGGNDWIPGLIN